MKLKLRLSKKREEKVRAELIEKQIEISEESDLILTEESYQSGTLICKADSEMVVLNLDEVCYMEALGRDVIIHTKDRQYKSSQRIYQLENSLPVEQFVRISNAVIIQRNSIKRILPGLSSKFYLTLTNGDSVTVTRTYYYKFKEFYKI